MAALANAKYETFCIAYLGEANFNKTTAAIIAGYAKKGAAQRGYELYRKSEVRARIAELMEERGITADHIKSELADIAFTDPMEVVTAQAGIRRGKNTKTKLIKSISYNPNGTRRVELYSRIDAMDRLQEIIEKANAPDAEIRAAWNSLHDVTASIFQSFSWTRLHNYIARLADQWITDLIYGMAPFVVLSMPPQHGKSEVTRMKSMRLLSIMPDLKGAYGSYNETFATRNGTRPIRDALTEHFPHLFTKKPDASASRWRTDAGGGMVAWGPNGGFTGEPADWIDFDDLIKNRAEYLSKARMDQIIDVLQMVARARMNNKTGLWAIGTHWGKGDAIDQIKTNLAGTRNVRVVRIPAIAGENDVLGRAPGEALWPERHSLEELLATEKIVGPLKWAAMWQQDPIDPSGEFFRYDRWGEVDAVPTDATITPMCRYWDLGLTKGGHGSAGALGCIKPFPRCVVKTGTDGADDEYAVVGEHYIKHIRVIREDSPVVIREIVRQAKIDGPSVFIGIEANGPQVAIYQHVRDLLPSEFKVFPRPSKPDKTTDAGTWQSEQWGGVAYLVNGEWVPEFMKRAEQFPAVDIDEVDAVSGMFWLARHYIRRGGGITQHG